MSAIITGDIIEAAARLWLGTPYHHQQRNRTLGVDCVGLIVGVGLDLGIMGADFGPDSFSPWAGYGRNPNPTKMLAGMQKFLKSIPAPGFVGDIVWMENRPGLPMHLAIVSAGGNIIHACGKTGSVIETRMLPERVHSWWRYPGAYRV